MTRSQIRACLDDILDEVAAANGASPPLGGTVQPANDIVGVTSAQLLSSTAELACRLGIFIPETENVFVHSGRAATMQEIADRLLELAQATPNHRLPSTR